MPIMIDAFSFVEGQRDLVKAGESSLNFTESVSSVPEVVVGFFLLLYEAKFFEDIRKV